MISLLFFCWGETKEEEEQEEQAPDEIKIPTEIDHAITGYNGQREPFTSDRLHSNITALYSQGDEPDFLTYQLGEQYYSDQTTRDTIQDLMKKAPVCVVGVSGAGKTRTVLEILSSQYGIYFSASMRLANPQTQKPCAKDLAWIADDSLKDPAGETLAWTLWRLDCAVVARFLVLQRKLDSVAESGGHFTRLDWVLMQLYPPTVPSPGTDGKEVDIFEALTAVIYKSFNKYERTVDFILDKQLNTLIKCIVVDEAQVAMQQNKDRYPNMGNSKYHPLLLPVIRALWEIGLHTGMCPILCGTGISMMQLSSIAVSAVATVQVKKRDPGDKYKMQVPISTVLDPQRIRTLLEQVLVSGVYEGHQLCQWSRVLMGRPRILWGFLALALARSDGMDEVFKEYCEDLSSREEGESSKTTLYSCVTRALNRKAVGETTSSPSVGDAFSTMVVNWITGQTPPDLEEVDKVDIIVDCGVCILERKGTKLVAKLREPLVVQAYLVFVRKTSSDAILKKIMSMLKAATEPSSQGFLFELLFYFALQGFLNGKSLQEAGFVPSAPSNASAPTPSLPDFFGEACDIPFDSIGNCLLRLPDSPGRGDFQLQSHFLNAHRDYLVSDKKRPRPRPAATPAKKDKDDLVVVAYTKNHVLIFLIQCKLEQNTDYLKAVQTTFPELLLHQAKKMKITTSQDKKILAELGREVAYEYQVQDGQKKEYLELQGLLNESTWGTRAVHVVQLVVAYPAVVEKLGETRWIPTTHCQNQLQLGMMLKQEPQQNENKRLLVVVRKDKLKELLGDEVFGRLEEVKAKKGPEVDCSPEPVNLADLLPYKDGDEKESD